jgi:hypothetical protein
LRTSAAASLEQTEDFINSVFIIDIGRLVDEDDRVAADILAR